MKRAPVLKPSIPTAGNRSYAMDFELRTGETFEECPPWVWGPGGSSTCAAARRDLATR